VASGSKIRDHYADTIASFQTSALVRKAIQQDLAPTGRSNPESALLAKPATSKNP